MKLNTVVITFKGLCFTIIGIFTPWAAALAQWIGTGEWPPKIVWVAVILPASAIGGASQLLSFLSGSFTDYQQQKLADDTQQPVSVTKEPTPAKVEPVVEPKKD